MAAEVKISELPIATAANPTDQLEANQAGTSRSITVAQAVAAVPLSGGPYLPLSGGTLTGGLAGTTADFSDYVAAATTMYSPGYYAYDIATTDVATFGFPNSNGPAIVTWGSASAGAGALQINTAGTNRMTINTAGLVTLSGALSGTTATFSGLMTALTPTPSSDNSTKVATTAFVQAAVAAGGGGGGTGTVTTVSVATANGLAGTVATATTTPVITLSTGITGMLKGNGTAISAATAGTDYMTPGNVSAAYQPLDTGLTALSGIAAGIVTNTAADTFLPRTITGTAARLSVTNGDGVAGNPTLNIDTAYVGQNTITTLGTVTTGTWNGSLIAGQYGGTGVANTGKTITLGGNLTMSGAFASTFTMSGTTTVTFPTTGTLATTAQLTAGTVTGVSVVSANGFAGTATATATPAITLSTTITGLLKGNATAISAAVANTDYLPVASPAFTGTLSGPTAAFSGEITAATASLADNDTTVATTAWVKGQGYTGGAGIYLPLTGGTLSGPGTLIGTTAAMSGRVSAGGSADDTAGVRLDEHGWIQIGAPDTDWCGMDFYKGMNAADARRWSFQPVPTTGDFLFSSQTDAFVLQKGWTFARDGSTALPGALTGTTATFSGKLTTVLSATTGAGLVLPHGAAPTTPGNGDIWTTTTGFYGRINGVTYQYGVGLGTVNVASAKTLAVNNTLTFAGTDATTMTFPPASSNVGYLEIPQQAQTGNYTAVMADNGKHLYHAVAAAAATYTIPANASVAYPIGATLCFVNDSANAVTIAITTDTLVLSPGTTTGSRTLATGGVATAIKVTNTRWVINGSGLT